eukprot:Phypoly_transcript_03282.p1 GENE.Phypoly_transcript_03282~~Phypoly_transcript_03282.p1  ORF type:complete len:817 (+),score=97.02 Phypoly_transcript_03282:362-2452(+)
MATINFHRPDVFCDREFTTEIPLNPPFGLFHEVGIPGVGDLMLATFPMDTSFNLSVSLDDPWWVGEKYDGIRCCWNPRRNAVYSRSGIEMHFPPTFTSFFPRIFLDGEVWFGRGNFDLSQNYVTSAEGFLNWDLLRIITFDVPLKYTNFVFEKRYAALVNRLSFDNPFTILATRISLLDIAVMHTLMRSMIENGGEGLILRKMNSLYERGRSRSLLKLKASANDAEAIVVSIADNSIALQMPNERTISLDITRDMPKLHKGDIVTYSFDGYTTDGLPINPIITRARTDVTWEDVVQNQAIVTPHASARPFGYWTAKDGENMRRFFEEFARNLNLDPLDPEIWYNIPRKAIEEIKGGETIIKHFKGYVDALIQIFPEIGLEEHKFPSYALAKHWKKVSNRREMFDNMAKTGSFDPLVPSNWYFITAERAVDPIIRGIVNNRYGGSYPKALAHVYPELNLTVTDFLSENHWSVKANRRLFFENIADIRSFDPLVPENWFALTTEDILGYQGARTVIWYHRDSFPRALEQLFPEMAAKLQHPLDMNFGNRKRFFENYAKQHGFDPLIAEHWYSVTNAMFITHKGASPILAHYNFSMSKGLQHVFPSIGIEESKFFNVPRKFWQDKENRKQLLLKFASAQGFDPLVPTNWYSAKLTSAKRMMGMLSHYNYSPTLALIDLLPSIGLDISLLPKHKTYRRPR